MKFTIAQNVRWLTVLCLLCLMKKQLPCALIKGKQCKGVFEFEITLMVIAKT